MGETLHKWRIGKNTSREILKENYYNTVKSKLLEIANSSKNLFLGHIFDP